ncbi:MAG TPA: VWA domain-containing protein [Blastocatellia bacterium]|nr:VWA domain-containing protein [Blastocatellia bacterium]
MAQGVRILFTFSMMLCAASNLSAQSGRVRTTPQPKPKEDDTTVRLRVEEVLLSINVRDREGRPASTLTPSDFIVTEDGKKQQVTSVVQTPANVVLVIDASGDAMNLKDNNLNRDLALKIIDSLGEKDRAAIISYGDSVNLLSGWTSDKAELRQALKWKLKPGIESSLLDCLKFASERLFPEATGRRSLVLLSDGVDSLHKHYFDDALEALHRARAIVYIVCQNARLLKELKPETYNPLSWYERLDPKARKRIDAQRHYYRKVQAAQAMLEGIAAGTGGIMINLKTRVECKEPKNGLFLKNDGLKDDEGEFDCESIKRTIATEIGSEVVIAYSSERRLEEEDFHLVKVFTTRIGTEVRSRWGIYSDLAGQERRRTKP